MSELSGSIFPGLLIEPGEIQMNYALRVVDDDHAKVWEIDLHSKYAEVLAYTHDEVGQPGILIHAGEHTLKLDESRRGMPTRIIAVGLDNWTVMAETARYTLRVIAYQPRHPQELP